MNRYRTGELSFTPREYEKILTVCNTLEEELLIQMAVSTGLRRIDISRIRIGDIDLSNGHLAYYEHKKRRNRVIPLSPKILQLLKKYLNSLPKNQEYLFSWGKNQYGDRTAYRRVQDLCDRAGIPRRPFHALRATCIKFCQKAGWSPEQVSELTGDTIRVIQEHYATPSKQEMCELVREKEIII
jgi:integrase